MSRWEVVDINRLAVKLLSSPKGESAVGAMQDGLQNHMHSDKEYVALGGLCCIDQKYRKRVVDAELSGGNAGQVRDEIKKALAKSPSFEISKDDQMESIRLVFGDSNLVAAMEAVEFEGWILRGQNTRCAVSLSFKEDFQTYDSVASQFFLQEDSVFRAKVGGLVKRGLRLRGRASQ